MSTAGTANTAAPHAALNSMPIQIDIVSAETSIYSGQALMVTVSGVMGDLGIVHGHSPLLSALKPGLVRIQKADSSEEIIYIQGGLLEVQPHTVTILADIARRARDLDEAAALASKESAERLLKNHQRTDANYATAAAELAQAIAQLKAISSLRKKLKV